jgi:predicted cobalt transporter CbtA
VFSAALVAGLHIAVLTTGLQALITTPMILHAETYKITDPAHELGQVGWKPTEGVERVLCTLLVNCGAGVGFALLLVVGLSFDFAAVSAVRGVIWGAVGFGFFTLAGILVPDEQAV